MKTKGREKVNVEYHIWLLKATEVSRRIVSMTLKIPLAMHSLKILTTLSEVLAWQRSKK